MLSCHIHSLRRHVPRHGGDKQPPDTSKPRPARAVPSTMESVVEPDWLPSLEAEMRVVAWYRASAPGDLQGRGAGLALHLNPVIASPFNNRDGMLL